MLRSFWQFVRDVVLKWCCCCCLCLPERESRRRAPRVNVNTAKTPLPVFTHSSRSNRDALDRLEKNQDVVSKSDSTGCDHNHDTKSYESSSSLSSKPSRAHSSQTLEIINERRNINSQLEVELETGSNMDQLKEKTQGLKTKLQSMKKPKSGGTHDAGAALKKLTDKLHIKTKKRGSRSAARDNKFKEMVTSLAEKSRIKKRPPKDTSGRPTFGRKPSTRRSMARDETDHGQVKMRTNKPPVVSDRHESHIDEIESEYHSSSIVENI